MTNYHENMTKSHQKCVFSGGKKNWMGNASQTCKCRGRGTKMERKWNENVKLYRNCLLKKAPMSYHLTYILLYIYIYNIYI